MSAFSQATGYQGISIFENNIFFRDNIYVRIFKIPVKDVLNYNVIYVCLWSIRVKQAIVKKEEVVAQLRQQYQAATKRADHLEGLLEQQRKQLLGKK